MKTIRQYIISIIILLISSACATSSEPISEKYNLDNQLERVPNITGFNLMSWDKIDNQSLVLQTGLDEYYLVILDCKCNKLPRTSNLRISNIDSLFWPAYSDVIINDDGWEDTYFINKIYRLKDCSQVDLIRAQLNR